jgi:hypothetical protein
MTAPSWLSYAFAAVMLATAAYCVARLVFARLRSRCVEHDHDIAHVLMGVAMAGMLVPRLDPLDGTVWGVVFALTTAWFVVRVVRARRAAGHHLPHLFLSAAMLYMYLAEPSTSATGGGTAGMAGMPGMGSAGTDGVRYPTVALALALVLCGYAVLVLDRMPQATATIGVGHSGGAAQVPSRNLLAPRSASCCDIAMCVTTAYLLITMV